MSVEQVAAGFGELRRYLLPHDRAAVIVPLTFGRVRLGVAAHENIESSFDDVW